MTEAEKAYQREYRLRNKERLKAQRATYRARNSATHRAWRAKNKERINELRRARYQRNPEKHIAATRAHYAKNADRIRRRTQLKRYGMTEEQYTVLAVAQNSMCAICGRELVRPHIDHDHDTGKIRGLLCTQCNTAIGLLQDSSKVAFNAANYLLSHGKS